MTNSQIKYIYYFSLFLLFFFHTTNAAVVNSFLNPAPGTTTLPEFLNDFYNFSIMISGIIAVLMIVVGGIYFVFSGAMPDKEREGKEIILGALWGLTLLLGAYFILKTVNPELTILKDPGGEIAKNVDYENCRAPKKTGDGGDNQINIVENLPFCKLFEYPPFDENGKCKCYVTDTWVSNFTNIESDTEDDGTPTIQGCENPYKNICSKYNNYIESVALECKALGDQQPQGLVLSDYGGLVNPSILENYKKAIECVEKKFPEEKGKYSFGEGWRSPASQYATKKEKGNKAAKPCCSNHGSGCALDIRRNGTTIKDWGTSDKYLKECMNKFGLKAELRESPNEPWHYSPSGH